MIVKFPNLLSGIAGAMYANLDSVAPTGPGYSLFGPSCQYAKAAPVDPRCRYHGPRVGMAGQMMTDEELLIAAAMAEKAAGVTEH
ncbi:MULTISPECIES: hypothetical protein [Pseudomonas]|uniref:hypothetical protein n=1 Tax=Pseudomonas TaxID=286 RepID=UPI0010C0D631|nr:MULTISPECIES: hypothetical protein [Pseudomonas]